MSFDTLFTLIILLLLAVVFPLLGVRDFRLLLRQTNEGVADACVKFYKGVLVFHWPLTIGLLAWWLLSGNNRLKTIEKRQIRGFALVYIMRIPQITDAH